MYEVLWEHCSTVDCLTAETRSRMKHASVHMLETVRSKGAFKVFLDADSDISFLAFYTMFCDHKETDDWGVLHKEELHYILVHL